MSSYSCYAKSEGQTNTQKTADSSGRVSNPIASTIEATARSSQSDDDYAPIQDPFYLYKVMVSTENALDNSANDPPPLDDGDTEAGNAEDNSSLGTEEQNFAKPRAASYNLAVRFADRSHGAPLATIIEHGSVSTLGSHGSILGVSRLPSIRAIENLSPALISKSASSKSPIEQALKDKQREACQRIDRCSNLNAVGIRRNEDRGRSDGSHQLATPAHPVTRKPQWLHNPSLHNPERFFEIKQPEAIASAVHHSVRAGARPWSQSTLTYTMLPEVLGAQLDDDVGSTPTVSEAQSTGQISMKQTPEPIIAEFSLWNSWSLPSDAIEHPATFSATSSKGATNAMDLQPSMLLSPLTYGSATESNSVPLLLPPVRLSYKRNAIHMTSAVRFVRLEPRVAKQQHVHAGATTSLHRSTYELLGQHTHEDFTFSRTSQIAPSLREYDCFEGSGRNASICSTMSSSYTGTVLGVDLDLQNGNQSERCSVTPMSFVRNMSESEALPPQKQDLHHVRVRRQPPRSMKSSALSALLSIAAAEGIVRLNYTTPQLSFFSPSGSLIQTEDCSLNITDTSRLNPYDLGTPATSISYYGNAGARSARPALVPMTTPPQIVAPLPEHLRHHHNYQNVQRSQITPEPETALQPCIMLTHSHAVKGCGGVVRTNSLAHHSGSQRSPARTRQKRKYCLSISRLYWTAASKSLCSLLSTRSIHQEIMIPTERTPHQRTRKESSVGPIIGSAISMCFCQPYDGSSKRPAHDNGSGMSDCCCGELYAGQARDAETPNARLVDSGDGKVVEKIHARRNDKGRSDRAGCML